MSQLSEKEKDRYLKMNFFNIKEEILLSSIANDIDSFEYLLSLVKEKNWLEKINLDILFENTILNNSKEVLNYLCSQFNINDIFSQKELNNLVMSAIENKAFDVIDYILFDQNCQSFSPLNKSLIQEENRNILISLSHAQNTQLVEKIILSKEAQDHHSIGYLINYIFYIASSPKNVCFPIIQLLLENETYRKHIDVNFLYEKEEKISSCHNLKNPFEVICASNNKKLFHYLKDYPEFYDESCLERAFLSAFEYKQEYVLYSLMLDWRIVETPKMTKRLNSNEPILLSSFTLVEQQEYVENIKEVLFKRHLNFILNDELDHDDGEINIPKPKL